MPPKNRAIVLAGLLVAVAVASQLYSHNKLAGSPQYELAVQEFVRQNPSVRPEDVRLCSGCRTHWSSGPYSETHEFILLVAGGKGREIHVRHHVENGRVSVQFK